MPARNPLHCQCFFKQQSTHSCVVSRTESSALQAEAAFQPHNRADCLWLHSGESAHLHFHRSRVIGTAVHCARGCHPSESAALRSTAQARRPGRSPSAGCHRDRGAVCKAQLVAGRPTDIGGGSAPDAAVLPMACSYLGAAMTPMHRCGDVTRLHRQRCGAWMPRCGDCRLTGLDCTPAPLIQPPPLADSLKRAAARCPARVEPSTVFLCRGMEFDVFRKRRDKV